MIRLAVTLTVAHRLAVAAMKLAGKPEIVALTATIAKRAKAGGDRTGTLTWLAKRTSNPE